MLFGNSPTGTIANKLTILSPVQYQVIQRNGSNQANINISLSYTGANPGPIEASFNGGAYVQLDTRLGFGTSNYTLANQNQGTGTLSIRAVNTPSDIKTVIHINIGIVILVIGQSNMGEQATNLKTYTNPTYDCCMFNGSYNESLWGQIANRSGSFMPMLGDALMWSQNCPVGFLECAVGGTSVVDWQPSNTSYTFVGQGFGEFGTGMHLYPRVGAMVTASGCGSVEMAIWHQGEADSPAMTANTYQTNLTTIVDQLHTDFGIKTLPAKLQQIKDTNATPVSTTNVNTGIQQCWDAGGNFVTGPDFSDLTADQDGFGYVHLKSDLNVQYQAGRWMKAICTYRNWTFSPCFDGMFAWFDPMVGLSVSGSDVTNWIDRFIYAVNWGQTSSSKRPTKVAASKNGKDIVRFDGALSVLEATTGLNLTNNVPGIGITIAYKPTTSLAAQSFYFGVTTGTNIANDRLKAGLAQGASPVVRLLQARRLDGDSNQTINTAASYAADGATWFTETNTLDFVNDGVHWRFDTYINNANVQTNQNVSGTGNTSATDALGMTLGAIYLTGTPTFQNPTAMDVGGVLLYKKGLNAARAEQNDDYYNNILAIH